MRLPDLISDSCPRFGRYRLSLVSTSVSTHGNLVLILGQALPRAVEANPILTLDQSSRDDSRDETDRQTDETD